VLTKRASEVFVENVEAGSPSGSSIGVFVTSVSLETWCAHELQWVVYERNTPPVRASSDTCAGTSAAYGCQRRYRETRPMRRFRDL